MIEVKKQCRKQNGPLLFLLVASYKFQVLIKIEPFNFHELLGRSTSSTRNIINRHKNTTTLQTIALVIIVGSAVTFLSQLDQKEKAKLYQILQTFVLIFKFLNFNFLFLFLFVFLLLMQEIFRGFPSKEGCAICKSQVLLSRSYVVNLIIFQPFLLQHTQKSIKLYIF